MIEKIKALCRKFMTREAISYLFFGVITTIINWVAYFVCDHIGFSTGVSVAIAWAVAVVFAFVVNKLFVFNSKTKDPRIVWHEFYTFIIARLLSLAFDAAFMIVSVDFCHMNKALAKLISNVFVMIMNYFASKFISFKKKESAPSAAAED